VEKFGVKNFLKIADLVFEIGNVAGLALEDGKISTNDFGLVFNLIDEVSSLSSVDWPEVKKEIMDFGADDAKEISEHFKAKFDIPQDMVESKIEVILDVIVKFIEAGFDVYSIYNDFKKN
jgi:hypothetical protein